MHGNGDERLRHERGLGGVELGYAHGDDVYVDGPVGRSVERSLEQLHGDAERPLYGDDHGHAFRWWIIDAGCADVQQFLDGADVHGHALGGGAGDSDAQQQRGVDEPVGGDLCDSARGSDDRYGDAWEHADFGCVHGRLNGRLGDYELHGDVRDANGDGQRESDHSNRADERDCLHLYGDGDEPIRYQRLVGSLQLGDSVADSDDVYVDGPGGWRSEHGVNELHGNAERNLHGDDHDHAVRGRAFDGDGADVQQFPDGADAHDYADGGRAGDAHSDQ